MPLYRRIDFVEHQLAAFVDDPDLAGADLIYVLDSPEMAAELAADATALHRLYGVPFRTVVLRRNLGFADANNAGVSLALGRLLLLLNSDVVPDRPGWLSTMVDFLDATPEVGAVRPEARLRGRGRSSTPGCTSCGPRVRRGGRTPTTTRACTGRSPARRRPAPSRP